MSHPRRGKLRVEQLENREMLAMDVLPAFDAFDAMRQSARSVGDRDVELRDVTPQLIGYDGAAIEGNNLTVPLQLTRPAEGIVTLKYRLEESTATIRDFSPQEGSVVFKPGQVRKDIVIPTIQDEDAEPAETFRVLITDVEGAETSVETLYGTIRDDDSEPIIRGVAFPSADSDEVSYQVHLSNPYKSEISVDWQVAAIGGKDISTGVLEFAPYQEVKTIRLPSLGEYVNYAKTIRLSNPSRGEIAPDFGQQIFPARDSDDEGASDLGRNAKPKGGASDFGRNTKTALPSVGIHHDADWEGRWLKIPLSLSIAPSGPVGAHWSFVHQTTGVYDIGEIRFEQIPQGTSPSSPSPASTLVCKMTPSTSVAGACSGSVSGTARWNPAASVGQPEFWQDPWFVWVESEFDSLEEVDETFKVTLNSVSGPATCGCPDPVIGTIKDLHFDLVLDNDNDGTVEDYNNDDNGIEHLKPKRIFVNTDDDNLNGKPDKQDDSVKYTTWIDNSAAAYQDNDFAKAYLGFSNSQVPLNSSWLTGHKLQLGVRNGMNAWADTQKTPLVADAPPIPGTYYHTYEWGLGDDLQGTVPSIAYIEATTKISTIVTWKLSKGSVTETSDFARIRSEEIVFPTDTYMQTSNWELNQTSNWKGFDLGDGWYIDKALVDYIKYPTQQGSIETVHPDLWCAACAPQHPLSSTETPDSDTVNFASSTLADGFTISFGYNFERSRNSNRYGYVQALSQVQKLSFVGNSGVKLLGTDTPGPGVKPYEAAIIDGEAMVNIAQSGLASFNPDINAPYSGINQFGQVANIPIDANANYDTEDLSKLMTGVVYGGDYSKMVADYDQPNSGTAQAEADAYYAALASNHQRSGSMTIIVSPSNLTIKINGVTTYVDDDFDQAVTNLRLQSHWGSGVSFYNFDIEE